MKIMNPDVPDSTIIKQLVAENKALKNKVACLEGELASKKRAIAGFKKWQREVAEYNYRYWLNEGLKFIKKNRVSPIEKFNAKKLSYEITQELNKTA